MAGASQSLGRPFSLSTCYSDCGCFPIFLGPAQVRLIGLSGYGQIVTVVLLAGMIASVANLGLSNSIIAKSAILRDPVNMWGHHAEIGFAVFERDGCSFLGAASTGFGRFYPNLPLGGYSSIAEGALAGFALSQSRLWLEGLRAAGKSGAYLGLSS